MKNFGPKRKSLVVREKILRKTLVVSEKIWILSEKSLAMM